MPYINISKSFTGDNTGSCLDLVSYLEKEIKYPGLLSHQTWFDQYRDEVEPAEVIKRIDANIAKLKKSQAKFFLINISPSEKELAHIGSDPERLRTYGRQVMEQYAKNFQKGIDGKDLLYFGKITHARYSKYAYKGDQLQKAIKAAQKEGNSLHIQIIVSRKDCLNKKLLSSLNNSSGRNVIHSSKFGQFNGVNFKQSCELAFDQLFDYGRDLQESFAYLNTMKNGSISERADMIIEARRIEKNEYILKKDTLK